MVIKGQCGSCYGGQIAVRDPKSGKWITVRCTKCNGTGKKAHG